MLCRPRILGLSVVRDFGTGGGLPPRATSFVQPNTLSAEDVDRVFVTYGALAFADFRQPEIGVRIV
jgi:hypothetical protein